MSTSRGLGRGLDSLIPTEVTASVAAKVNAVKEEFIKHVDPGVVAPNPHQPRITFQKDELKELSDSILQHGILHPPVVSERKDGTYELVAGERRVRAAKLAGLKQIPVIVRSHNKQQKLELALLENVQRAQLNPIETAAAYHKLATEFNLTVDEIGKRMGKARSTVANNLRLLELPRPVLDAISSGTVSEAHGRAIVALQGAEKQLILFKQVVEHKLSVRQTEAAAKTLKDGAAALPSKAKAAAQHTTNQLTSELESLLKVKVRMQPKARGGKLVIEYRNGDELQRIIDTIRTD